MSDFWGRLTPMKTSALESLESRRLLHADFSLAVNFTPVSAPKAPGMAIDYGSVYDVRRGGISYGWNTGHESATIDNLASRVQRNDTFIRMATGSKWEVAVPNGDYSVYVVSGDVTHPNERIALRVEGAVAVAGFTRKLKPFLEGAVNVTVADGKLTLTSAGIAGQDKINYLAIRAVHTNETPVTPTISIAAPVNSAAEGGVAGRFRLTRTGDASAELTVPLVVTGTATNGTDYGRIGATATFAAGQTQIELPVTAISDGTSESSESVIVTLGAVAGHQITNASATVTITDVPLTLGSLSWSARKSMPVARVEGMSAVAGGKLYVFGGYVDQTWAPVARVDCYDPATNTWTRKADMPERISHCGTASDGRYIYFAGGYPGKAGNAQGFATTTVRRYDSQTDTYVNLKPLPQARGGGELYLLNGSLHYVAGSDVNRVDHKEVWALDLSNSNANWVARASLPEVRNHFGGAVINGKLYIAGGQTGQEDWRVFRNNTWVYDPATNAWSALANVPSPLRSHAMTSTFAYKGRLIIVGGETPVQVGNPVSLSSALMYNPATNAWSSITSLPGPRSTAFCGVIGDTMYVTGGYSGATFFNTTWAGNFA